MIVIQEAENFIKFIPIIQNKTFFFLLLGAFPDSICQLYNLEELCVSKNQLTGNIPKKIGDLTSLKLLVCQENRLSGK